jgi:predicted Zn-ribbon and HTH transcriptional regulator
MKLSHRALLCLSSLLSGVGKGLSLAASLLGAPSRCASCWHEFSPSELVDVETVGSVCPSCASLVDPLGYALRRGR